MIRGSCLCGGIRFEVESVVGPFELCHCTRCRKASGSAFMAAVAVRAAGFRYLSGRELVRRFELPVRDEPPPYSRVFCERCGCVVPEPDPQADEFEIAAEGCWYHARRRFWEAAVCKSDVGREGLVRLSRIFEIARDTHKAVPAVVA